MIESTFLDYLSKFKVTTYTGVEDFGDKFSFLYSVVVLSLCTVIITAKSYLLNPISCYIATELGGTNLLKYVENYCWVQGTIPISYNGKMPQNEIEWAELENKKILYYQWVPFVLGLQCCLFYLPHVIWQAVCYNRTGTDLQSIMTQAMAVLHADQKSRQSAVECIAENIEHLLFQRQKRIALDQDQSGLALTGLPPVDGSQLLSGRMDYDQRKQLAIGKSYLPMLSKRRSTYITLSYIFVKMLYLGNALGQIFLMQRFLGFNTTHSPVFGHSVLRSIVQGHDWQLTQIFPRVGFCYVEMKLLGVRTNAVTAQCALPVNMLNEKLYIFLWWWIMAAAIITATYVLLWLFRFCTRSRQADYILKYIRFNDSVEPFDERDANDFASQFLCQDGIFLVRMVRMNAGDVVAATVVNTLWNRYQKRLKDKSRNPLTNVLFPNAWCAKLQKGGGDDADDADIRKRLPSMDCSSKHLV